MKSEYDLIFRFYDPLLHLPLGSVRRSVMDLLRDQEEKRILDLCCGTGEQLKLLSRNGFDDLHGLDISASMLKIAKRDEHLKIYNQDAAKTDFETGSFDIILISLAFHEIDRGTSKRILTEVHRLLRDDGSFIVVDYDYDEKTAPLAKIVIFLIERSAGKKHYGCFKEFIRNSGLSSLIGKEKFYLVEHKKELYNSMTISKYKKKHLDLYHGDPE